MTRSVANRTEWRDEQGTLLVLTAILVPAIVMLGALTFGVTSLWTSHDDVQRSADMGSTAGAMIVPTAVVTPSAAYLPFPIEGKKKFHQLTDQLDPGDWSERVCDVAYAELGQDVEDRSKLTQGFKTTSFDPHCNPEWIHESPTLAAVGACAGNLLDVPGCGSTLRSELAKTIPALDAVSQDVTDTMTAAEELAADFVNPLDKLMTRAAAQRLPGGCTKRVTSLLGDWTCIERASDLLNPLLGTISNTLSIAPSGTPQFGVNLDQLLPAVMTPRVKVTMENVDVRPTFSPFTFDVTNSAVARRTIKTALVLPSGAIPYPELSAELDGHFGLDGAALALKAEAGLGGYAIDPNILTRTANRRVDRTIGLVDRIDGVLNRPILNSFMTAACSSGALSKYCPIVDTDDATRQMRGQFVQDLRDATRPPPKGAEPSLQEWLDDAADAGDPVLLVQTLSPKNMRQFFGATAWSALTDESMNPALAPLLSDLMYIPALDVVPATVGRVQIGPNRYYVLRSIAMDTLATKGLYQARLVK